MRIAFVADDLYPGYGGQASATEGHIAALHALGHELRVLAGDERKPTAPPPGVRLTRLPVWRPGDKMTHFVLPRRQEIAALLDWAEVVQVNTPTPFALLCLRMARRREIPTAINFNTQEESTSLHFGAIRPLVTTSLRGWYSYFYRQADCLIAPTDFAARLLKTYSSRPCHIVSYGIHLPPEGQVEEGRAESMRARLSVGVSHLLCYVGRLSHEKNPMGMLEVAAALRERRRDVRLVIAGTGPLEAHMKAAACRLDLDGQVRFLGYVSEGDKRALLRASDLFIMPSPTELQSIATLEAAAQGCATVVADYPTSAVGEWVSEADCGLLYDPYRPSRAAEAISDLLDDYARLKRYRHNAKALAREHDVLATGRRLERIYGELVEKKAAAP
jgi:1,2-diacylglycerol 3-alpha-glucosyltransferase